MMHIRLRQKFRAASDAATASRTRSRCAVFAGHEPQHALLIAAQSASDEHARHAAGIASTRVGREPPVTDALGAATTDALGVATTDALGLGLGGGGGDSPTGVLEDATATSFGAGASVLHATSASAIAAGLTA